MVSGLVAHLCCSGWALLRVYRGECQAVIDLEREAIEARDAMAQRRKDYIEANRRLKIIHRLEESARAKHRLEDLRAAQNELDELAGFRAFRQPVLS